MTTDASNAASPAGIAAPVLGSVFEAVGGLRNRPAIIALLGCLIGGVLLGGLLVFAGSLGGTLFAALAFLVYAVAVAVGVNAAGLLQMDEARGLPPRPLPDALAGGLICLPKLIVLGLAMLAVWIGVVIVVALLFLLCKIPFLGPMLYVVVFPLSVVACGFTLWAGLLCLALSLPAIWQGATLGQALTQTLAIARGRLVESLLLLLALGVLCIGVSLVVFGVLGVGMGPTLALSASLLGFGGSGGMTSLVGGAGGGIAVATFIGASLLWAVAASLVGQVYLRGLSIIYLRLTKDKLDVASAAAAWRSSVDVMRGRGGVGDDTIADRPSGSPAVRPPSVAAPVPATPPASFEAMQSAAFGGLPVVPASRSETSGPLSSSVPPRAAPPPSPDIDLGFDATAPDVDPMRYANRGTAIDLPLGAAVAKPGSLPPPANKPSSDAASSVKAPITIDLPLQPEPADVIDLPLEASSPATVDLLFDDVPPRPSEISMKESAVATAVDLPFDDLLAPAAPPIAPLDLFGDDVTRIGAPAASTNATVSPSVPPTRPPATGPAATPAYAAPPVWTPPPTAAAAPPAPKPPPLLTACPQCLAPVAANDVFCGVCGYRLK